MTAYHIIAQHQRIRDTRAHPHAPGQAGGTVSPPADPVSRPNAATKAAPFLAEPDGPVPASGTTGGNCSIKGDRHEEVIDALPRGENLGPSGDGQFHSAGGPLSGHRHPHHGAPWARQWITDEERKAKEAQE